MNAPRTQAAVKRLVAGWGDPEVAGYTGHRRSSTDPDVGQVLIAGRHDYGSPSPRLRKAPLG